MNLLLTGFNAFGPHPTNPSERLARQLQPPPAIRSRLTMRSHVLPTEFGAVRRLVPRLLAEHQPDAWLALGLDGKRAGLSLERRAVNRNDARRPDNAGECPRNRPILPHGPPEYASTLPLAAMCAALRQHSIPVRLSDDAGTFVCNHLLYLTLHAARTRHPDLRCGFIHVPIPAQSAPHAPGHERPATSPLTLAELDKAVQICLSVIAASA